MTISEFTKALGGHRTVAQALLAHPEAVRAWVRNNAIPYKHHFALLRLAMQAGVAVTPDDLAAMRERDE